MWIIFLICLLIMWPHMQKWWVRWRLHTWLRACPPTKYGQLWAQRLTPCFAAIDGDLLLGCPGLGAYARFCDNTEELARVYVEGIVRALLDSGLDPCQVHLPAWGAAGTQAARLLQSLTYQEPYAGSPGEFVQTFSNPNPVEEGKGLATYAFAWDPLAQPGNEYALGMMTSGDPAILGATNFPHVLQTDASAAPLKCLAPPALDGGVCCLHVYEWCDESGMGVTTAVPVTSAKWAALMSDDHPMVPVEQFMLPGAKRRCHADTSMETATMTLTVDPKSRQPAVWEIDWSGTHVVFTVKAPPALDHVKSVYDERQRGAWNGTPTLVGPASLHDEAQDLLAARPVACLGMEDSTGAVQELVVWDVDDESGGGLQRRIVLVPSRPASWDAFATQEELPLWCDAETLAQFSVLCKNVRFYNGGNLFRDVGVVDTAFDGTYGNVMGIPGIRMEHRTPLTDELLTEEGKFRETELLRAMAPSVLP